MSARRPPATKPPDKLHERTERLVDAGVQHVFVNVRCPAPMAVGLRRQALIDGTDISVLVREAITEWAGRRKVNIRTL